MEISKNSSTMINVKQRLKIMNIKPEKINREQEIRKLLSLNPKQVLLKAQQHLKVCDNLDDLHKHMAESIYSEIESNLKEGNDTNLILPIGPTSQYPHLIQKLTRNPLDLSKLWIFFMDEYSDYNGHVLPKSHPLSFRGIAEKLFLNQIPTSCQIQGNQIIFPSESNIDSIPEIIKSRGGINVCYGGIGIHGHIAFNEPEFNISLKSCRKVKLNRYTITINAIRSKVGGNLENFPQFAYTLGMKEILSAKKIRLYCRNGSPYDWANTVLRLSVLGTPSDDYPVTYIRKHSNYQVITDQETLNTPQNII